jgi:hypothetical protein
MAGPHMPPPLKLGDLHMLQGHLDRKQGMCSPVTRNLLENSLENINTQMAERVPPGADRHRKPGGQPTGRVRWCVLFSPIARMNLNDVVIMVAGRTTEDAAAIQWHQM